MDKIVEQDKNNKVNVNTNSGLKPYALSENDRTKLDPFKNVKVTSVYDGDTFRVNLNDENPDAQNVPIRVKGIDTPEIKGETQEERDAAVKAKQFTSDFLQGGEVNLQDCVRDKYFRQACDVFVNDKSLADALLEQEGLAYKYDGLAKKSFKTQEQQQTQKVEEEKTSDKKTNWYREADVVDFLNSKNNENEVWYSVGQNKFVNSVVKDRQKILFDNAVRHYSNPDYYIRYQPQKYTMYDKVLNSEYETFGKAFLSSGVEMLGGVGNVAISAIKGVGSGLGYLAGSMVGPTKQNALKLIEQEKNNLLDRVKNEEDYFIKNDLSIKLTDDKGNIINYCPKEVFDYVYGKIENNAIGSKDKDRAKNEAVQFFNSLPEWQRASKNIISIAEKQASDLQTLKEIGNQGLIEAEKTFTETANAIQWFIEEIGLDLNEHDAKNPLSAQMGSGAFSVALSLSGLFLPSVGYALPALFTAMTYDESIRHGLENGLDFRSAAARSILPAAASGVLEKMQVTTLINSSKTFKQAWIKSAKNIWLNETLQEISQDTSVMLSEELMGLASYDLAQYMSTAVQDTIFTTITGLPSSFIITKRMNNIAQNYIDRGYKPENAFKIASTIIEEGQSALNNKELADEIVKASEEAAMGSKYQKVSADITIKPETRFDNPKLSRSTKSSKEKAKQAQQEINEEEQRVFNDVNKKEIQIGTLKDLLANSNRAQNVFAGKMAIEDVQKELHEVEEGIFDYINGQFTMPDEVARATAISWANFAKLNFLLSDESVTPKEFVNKIMPNIVHGFAINVHYGFEGLREETKKAFTGTLTDSELTPQVIAKLIKNKIKNDFKVSDSDATYNNLVEKMTSMSYYLANIIKSDTNLSDEDALEKAINIVAVNATGKYDKNMFASSEFANLSYKIRESVSRYLVNNQQSTAFGISQVQTAGEEQRKLLNNLNFWQNAHINYYGAELTAGERTKQIRELMSKMGLDVKKQGSLVVLGSEANANTAVHETTHALTDYIFASVYEKQKNNIPLTRTENAFVEVVNDFVSKNKKELQKLYKQYKKDQTHGVMSYDDWERRFVSEFLATTMEYGIMTGQTPKDKNGKEIESYKTLFDGIKQLNDSYHYGDYVNAKFGYTELLGDTLGYIGGQRLKTSNRSILEEQQRRQNVANATHEALMQPDGSMDVDLVVSEEEKNNFIKAQENFAQGSYNTLFEQSSFMTMLKIREDVHNILINKQLSPKEKLQQAKEIVKNIPNTTKGLETKLIIDSALSNKKHTVLQTTDILTLVDQNLQDLAVLEAFGLKRVLAKDEKKLVDNMAIKGQVKSFLSIKIPQKVRDFAERLPGSKENKEKLLNNIDNAIEKYKNVLKFISDTSKAIDEYIDKAYKESPTVRMIVDGYNKTFTPISDWAKKLNPTLSSDMKNAVFAERMCYTQLEQPVIELSKLMYENNIQGEKRNQFTLMMLNQQWDSAKEWLISNGVKNADELLSKIRENLDLCYQIIQEADPFGDGGIGFIKNYFPRILKNVEGYKQKLYEQFLAREELRKEATKIVNSGMLGTTIRSSSELTPEAKKRYEERLKEIQEKRKIKNKNNQPINTEYVDKLINDGEFEKLPKQEQAQLLKDSYMRYKLTQAFARKALKNELIKYIASELNTYINYDETKKAKFKKYVRQQLGKDSYAIIRIINSYEKADEQVNEKIYGLEITPGDISKGTDNQDAENIRKNFTNDPEKFFSKELSNSGINNKNLYDIFKILKKINYSVSNDILYTEVSDKKIDTKVENEEGFSSANLPVSDFIKSYVSQIKNRREFYEQNYAEYQASQDIKDAEITDEGLVELATEALEEMFGKIKQEEKPYGFMRNRKTEIVTPEMIGYYHDALDGLSLYFSQVARIAGMYQMLGKGAFDKINGKLVSDAGKNLKTQGDEKLKNAKEAIYKEYVFDRPVGNELKETKQDGIYRLKLWGEIINMLGYSTGDAHKDTLVAKILDSYFLRSGAGSGFTIYRNINNILTINNLFSALSNFGDLVLTTYRYGSKNTLLGSLKAAKGRENSSVDIEPLIENLYEEFRTDSLFWNKALDFVFKWSGFKAFDLFTKRANLEAALSTLKNNKEDSKQYKNTLRRLQEYFGVEFDENDNIVYEPLGETGIPKWQEVLQDIKTGKTSLDVKFFLFNELSGQQPLTLAEVPYAYNKYPWTRLFYQFKTFSMRQMSFLFNEVIGNKLKKDPARGLRDLFYFITALLMLNVPESIILAIIKNEGDVSLTDEAASSIARFFMVNKKSYYNFREAQWAAGIASMAIPTPPVLTRALSDAEAVIGDTKYKAKTMSSVPVVGEPARVLFFNWLFD